jgi:hypothetical protein
MRPAFVGEFWKFLHTLHRLKTPSFLCVAFAGAMIVPAQTLELYRHIAQSLADSYASGFSNIQGLAEGVGLIAYIALLSIAFLALASFLYALSIQASANEDATEPSTRAFSLIAAIPCLAVSLGLLRATIDTHSAPLHAAMLEGARISFEKDLALPEIAAAVAGFAVNAQLQINWWLYAGAILLLLSAGVLSLAADFFFLKLFAASAGLSRAGGTRLIAVGIGCPILLSLVFVFLPVGLPRAISSFGIICLFFAAAALFLAAFSLLEARVRIPALFLLIVCAVTFSFLGLNDNHGIRQLTSAAGTGAKRQLQSIGDGFGQWLQSRKDLARYDAYPVYLIAAEGGGIYAAYRTATLLTSLQDQCPRFSHHLFAISSVSGGSVGAAVYSGLAQKIKQGNGRFAAGAGCRNEGDNAGGLFFTDVAEDVLRDDFLSPVLASFLFPDFLQRLLFFPVPPFDRAIALEKSIEASWDQRIQGYQARFPDQWIDRANPLRASFNKSWDAGSDSPALFINSTEVESGRGRVIAPFAIETEAVSNLPLSGTSGDAEHGDIDIALSTAAVLSARFPLLTPPGLVRLAVTSSLPLAASPGLRQQPIQLVDGGYLDNSGVVTALNVVREIKAAAAKANPPQKLQITLIVLTSGDFAPPSDAPGDYLTPVQALLSTRGARGAIAIKQAENFFEADQSQNQTANSLDKVILQGYGYPLPLGWRLSPITRLLILGQNGNPTRCVPAEGGANCVRARISDELSK